jgi:NADPH2:quinone reductase
MDPFGTATQHVVLLFERAVRLLENTDLATGACHGIPALTAYHSIPAHGGVEAKHILWGGSARAGDHYAIQLARLEGAPHILATVSGSEKAALAHKAGQWWANLNKSSACKQTVFALAAK